jgi:hypothetical protein
MRKFRQWLATRDPVVAHGTHVSLFICTTLEESDDDYVVRLSIR